MKLGKSIVAVAGILILNLILVACGAGQAETHEAPHWSYSGEGGPENWGSLEADYELCGIGTEQSPIDLSNSDEQDLENIEFDYAPSQINILNNGHTIQVNYDPGSTISLDGHEFQLLQFHFHAPSEHTVDGRSFPAELHLVHQDADGALAVVGILLETGAENEALSPVWADLPAEETEVTATGGMVDASLLLPTDQATFRYAGSLTTPPCSEGVSWFVMTTPVEISQIQLDEFLAIFSGNNRPLQTLGDRELIEDTTP